MKNSLLLITALFISGLAYSQSPNYDDLKILYADANYEKLAKVAAGYTEKDKTKKEIPPYIWLSKGLYKISLSGTDNEKFKNAYNDAIKYLSKGIQYDIKYNEGSTIAEHKEFIDKFQLSLFEIIDNEISDENYGRAYGWGIKYNKITTNQIGPKYLMGACKYEDQDKPTARTLWQEGNKMLEELTSIEGWSEADLKMFKAGLLYSASALKKTRQGDKAKDLLNKSAQWFEDDDDWKVQYDEIVN
tara:strand:- start:3 stop:737 length:735 start_codon:yes stop_codon:yes gene_type:complete